MTDLSKGIIDFGDMVVTPNTTKNELLAVYGDKLSPTSIDKLLDFNMLFFVDRQKFMCFFHIDTCDRISRIVMRPCIKYSSETWDRTGRQEERRQFCDAWLYDRLGEPDRNLGGAEYVYEHIRISCVTHFDQQNGADAGYIVVNYLR